jgi:hypothetical protein
MILETIKFNFNDLNNLKKHCNIEYNYNNHALLVKRDNNNNAIFEYDLNNNRLVMDLEYRFKNKVMQNIRNSIL